MENKQFTITINAPKEKVWSSLFEDANYREWTSAFMPGSWADTDWKKGSKARFLGETEHGMVSEIADARENEFMSIRHLGLVNDGVEDTTSEKSQEWAGSLENYTIREKDGKSEVIIDLQSKSMPKEYMDYFETTWPKALENLKQIAERN